PAHLALADTKVKSDVPPGAAAEQVKAAEDQETKPEKPEPKKSEPAAPAKPADAAKLPTDGRAAKELDSAKPVLSKQIIHEVQATPRIVAASRYVERSAIAAKPYRVKAKQPVKLALADVDKRGVKTDKAAQHGVNWSYEGGSGPQHWAELKPEFAACATGKRQSPIDIQDGARLDLEPIKFDYRAAPLRIVDNGHTVQVNYAEGSSITVSGVR